MWNDMLLNARNYSVCWMAVMLKLEIMCLYFTAKTSAYNEVNLLLKNSSRTWKGFQTFVFIAFCMYVLSRHIMEMPVAGRHSKFSKEINHISNQHMINYPKWGRGQCHVSSFKTLGPSLFFEMDKARHFRFFHPYCFVIGTSCSIWWYHCCKVVW